MLFEHDDDDRCGALDSSLNHSRFRRVVSWLVCRDDGWPDKKRVRYEEWTLMQRNLLLANRETTSRISWFSGNCFSGKLFSMNLAICDRIYPGKLETFHQCSNFFVFFFLLIYINKITSRRFSFVWIEVKWFLLKNF